MPKPAPNPIDKHIGARVRERYLAVGMSQPRLGQALGVSFQQVQKYLKGENRIPDEKILVLSQVLQTPVRFFYTNESFEVAVKRDQKAGDVGAQLHEGPVADLLVPVSWIANAGVRLLTVAAWRLVPLGSDLSQPAVTPHAPEPKPAEKPASAPGSRNIKVVKSKRPNYRRA